MIKLKPGIGEWEVNRWQQEMGTLDSETHDSFFYDLEKLKTWPGIWNNNKIEKGDREDIIVVILEQETKKEEKSLEAIFEEIKLVKDI